MGLYKPRVLPLIPLAKETVLLPGIILRIPIGNRPDIPQLLAKVYSRQNVQNKADASNIAIGVVPLNSSLLNSEGQRLIAGSNAPTSTPAEGETSNDSAFEDLSEIAERLGRIGDGSDAASIDPGQAKGKDIYGYGVVAKIVGIEGRGTGDLSIVVEGVSRFKIEKMRQERPYFIADVAHHNEEGEFLQSRH
jgi:ATP-dependent Lon protease